MTFANRLSDFWAAVVFIVKWILLTAPLGIAVGSACALFLWLLDLATSTRENHMWLIYCMPLAGAAIGGLYVRFGKSA